ncbi:MAG: hypothetical protein AAGC88_03315 [Bacteroidota bacterium]
MFLSVWSFGQIEELESTDELDTASYIWLKSTRLNPYLTAELERATLLEEQVSNVALNWGLLVNDRFTVGTFISIMTSEASFPLIFPNGFNLELVHGGIHLGYQWPVTKAFSAGLDGRLGFGEMEVGYQESGFDIFSTRFTSINPSITADYQVSRFLKLTAGLGYRFLGGYDFNTDEVMEMDGATMRVGVKIGLFKRLKWSKREEEEGNED